MTPNAHNPTLEADRAGLEELRDLGLSMARLVVARAHADADAGVDIDRSAALERYDRGVRRAIFLLQHIAREAAKADANVARAEQTPVRARRQIIRDVEDCTVRRPEAEQEAFIAELKERLDDPEFDDDLSGMTVAQASQLIRRDFGLGEIFTHRRRTPADVKALAARARHSAEAAALLDHPGAVPHPDAHLRRKT